MTTPQLSSPEYPVQVTGRLDGQLSRWLWLVKWVLVIPHLFVLVALWAGFAVTTLVALVAILVTGRYPRRIFAYNVGVLRWTWRVSYYAYGALGTDAYPPFTLEERSDYPAHLQVQYPQHLSRGLALVKWWLLALPHYLIVGVFVGGGAWAYQSDGHGWQSGGLVSLLVLIAGVVLLVTGTYPRTIFDFVLGMNRWALRVVGYAGLMTDRYPPFRLDQGGSEPGHLLVAPPDVTAETPAGPMPPRRPVSRWSGGRVTGVVLGSLVCLVGVAISVVGTGLLVVNSVARDDNGTISSDARTYRTQTPALVESDLALPVKGPAWFYGPEQLGRVTITVSSVEGRAVFLGIGPSDEVRTWLGRTAHDEITDPANGKLRQIPGSLTAPNPETARFWAASADGRGKQTLTWTAREGNWTVVAMNADGRTGVHVVATAGATFPHLKAIGVSVLLAGMAFIGIAVLTIILAIPRHETRARRRAVE